MSLALIINAAFAVVIIPAAASCVNREAYTRRIHQDDFLAKLTLVLGPFINGISIDGAFNDGHEPDIQPDKLEKLKAE